ncbi:hypothetical protein ASD00_29245 [Ensifer sp. Root31]|uniref:alpha/beta fold hydrolase n=1 Tax=Ensifer sp. Root31 TaxID=1736512 RepID=UPI00070AEC2C|nr:alpha/beta hydrolase [Ensifer sp. Root31]KQU88097.1 hypothetical protein ASD00_29245 [Ensifer sp. Root31]
MSRIVHDTGSGPAVLMAHGTMMDWSMFIPQILALRDHNRIVAFNQRARTDAADTPYSLSELAADCRLVMDELGIERCVLAGMSMGGFMAMEFANLFPERIDGLILIGSQIGAYTNDEQALFGAEFAKFNCDGKVTRDLAEGSASLVFGATSTTDRKELIGEWIERWSELPARSVYYETQSWLSKSEHRTIARSVNKPVLVVHGEEDYVLPIDAKTDEMRAAFPDVEIARIAKAGHLVNLEQPAATNNAIARFLARIGYRR